MSFSAKKHNVQYIINLGRYPSKLKMSTIVPVFECDDRRTQIQISFFVKLQQYI